MKQSFSEVAQKLGLTTSSLQAVLWYYEQALYSAHGTPKESWSFSDAARRAQVEEKAKATSQPEAPLPEPEGQNPREREGKYKDKDAEFNPEDFENPKQTVSGDEVVKHVMKTADTTEEYARELVGLDAGGDYTLEDVPISKITTKQEGTIPRFAKQYARMSTPLPPIVLDMDLGVRDGNHRLEAAKLRGDTTVKAYVPVDSYQK